MNVFTKISKTIGSRLDKNAWVKDNFNKGYEEFLNSGTSTEEAYHAMIKLYCLTNGTFNESISKQISAKNPPVKQQMPIEGVVGKLDANGFTKINRELKSTGYSFFDKKLSAELIKALTEFALRVGASIPPKYDTKIVYNPENALAEIYRFDPNDLINNQYVQSLVMDPTLMNIARNYLGCEPILAVPAMWWSTSFSKEASSEAAQLYHFDMDRIKWLKIFIYLNDVTSENGPHCYIRGTHAVGGKPEEILKKGYERISDAELRAHYKKEDFVEISAPAGTIFAGDTLCFHKGKPLEKGHRLVFELEYCNSLFGAYHPSIKVKNASNEFKDFCKKNKRYVSGIQIIN